MLFLLIFIQMYRCFKNKLQYLLNRFFYLFREMACNPTIVIHGGAWAIPDKLAKQSEEGVQAAAKTGYEILMNGGSAVDAVEAAVVSMEDDPAFDAGYFFSLDERNRVPTI